MTENINFRARSKTEFDVQLKPYPAIKSLPKWYLESNPFIKDPKFGPDSSKTHVRNRTANHNFKKCTPLLDGMSTGYIIPLWADVEVDNSILNSPQIFWKTRHHVFEPHGVNTREIEPPVGYHQQVFKYMNCWIPQTPKGYSCLIVSPFGYNDSAFKAVPAVIDTDKSTLELIFPTWVKKDFNGIVEKGTPMATVIPFKRTDWKATFDYYEDGEYWNVVEEKTFNGTMIGHYLRNYWSKKKFE
jgi:hypothetical protein